ncbi:MAG: cupin domain-containing protein [Alphaproteobacteria bacterium]|jgi:mannose-6-phosphate isomerase-like protein (cupin superfamily)
MSKPIQVKQVADVPIERMQEKEGWAISEFRLPFSGDDGSRTTVFHSIFRSGSTHNKHLHTDCEEIAVYLSGHGVVGQSDSRAVVTAGHCRMMPRGSAHFFHNETEDADAVVIGFYMGSGSVADTGYQLAGMVEQEDLDMPREGLNEGILVRLQDTPDSDLGGLAAWSSARVRQPIGSHNGSDNALLNAELDAGSEIGGYTLAGAEQIWFVTEGEGVAVSDGKETPIGADSFIFVPAGTELAIRNTGSGPLSFIGVLTGAGSLEDAGYADAA